MGAVVAEERCGAERAIRRTTTLSVVVLAAMAAILSYKHMYLLVRCYGETSWTAALLPISVDGMFAASPMSPLLDSVTVDAAARSHGYCASSVVLPAGRQGRRGRAIGGRPADRRVA
jgi:hypothetical protein